MHGRGLGTVEQVKRFGQNFGQRVHAPHGAAVSRHLFNQGLLVVQLMQMACAAARVGDFVDTGNHQHWNRIGLGLRHRRGDVAHARAGDDEAHAHFA